MLIFRATGKLTKRPDGPGYHVITPMKINGSGILIAINRGWVPADPRREILPRVPAFQDEQTVRGVAVKPLERAYELSGPVAAGPVKQNLALDRLGTEWGMPLQPVVVQQTGDVPDGLVRDWPASGSGSERNLAYAVQWYALSALSLGLWFWFGVLGRGKRPEGAPDARPTDPS